MKSEKITLVIDLYPKGGSMYAALENWRPLSINRAIDPEARTFAEGLRQLVVKAMTRRLRVPRAY